MIKVEKHKEFKGYFEKLSEKQKRLFEMRINLMMTDPHHPLLRVHRLKGKMQGQYSFSLGGDLRVIFLWPEENRIVLHRVGTHNQVY